MRIDGFRTPPGRFLLRLCTVIGTVTFGLSPLPGPARDLKVGLSGSPPFVMREGEIFTGISLDMWRELAAATNLTYRIVPQSTTDESLRAVADGRLDLAIGPISITPERLERQKLDFTQPYFYSHVSVLTEAAPPGIWERIAPFFRLAALSSLVVLMLSLFLVGNLIWLAERERNSEHFPKPYLRGVGNGMWFAVVTLTTVGYGDRAPVTIAGRWISGVWMLVTLLAVSSITAGLASAFTVSLTDRDGDTFRDPSELRGASLAVIDGTTSVQWGRYVRARIRRTDGLPAAVALLESGQVKGVIFDEPALRTYLAEHPDKRLRLADFTLATESYGIALPENSDLQRDLDIALLKLRQAGRLREITEQWLP